MSEVNVAQIIKGDQKAESAEPKKGEGKLTIAEGEHSVYPMEETAEVSRPISEMLEEFNLQPKPELSQMLEKSFIYFPKQVIDEESEIQTLSSYLESHDKPNKDGLDHLKKGNLQLRDQPKTEKHTSLFSLARSVNSSLNQKEAKNNPRLLERGEERSHIRTSQGFSSRSNTPDLRLNGEALNDLDYQEHEDDEGRGQGFTDQEQEQEDKGKKGCKIKKVSSSCSTEKNESKHFVSSSPSYSPPPTHVSGQSVKQSLPVGIGDLYIRFMALMARILGQAESEAHSLYNRIKKRTDAIDTLTTLLQKINNAGGEIDWTENPEMCKLIDQVRGLGVEIPEGKYSWTKEEAVLLKENIQMRKDSMEKITQLERTDMQRFLQEASQCHQARSNVLKLLKEVMDTIIHNMRGG